MRGAGVDHLRPVLRAAARPVAAVAVAFLFGGALLSVVGANPFDALRALVQGAVGSVDSLAVTGVRMTPLLFVGLGVALSFRAGVFNIGTEGQLYLGAVGATAVGTADLGLPAWLHAPLALAAGFAGGALWAALPGYFRAYRGVSEVVLTLMLNYVGIELTSYLVDPEVGPLAERGASYSQSPSILMSSRLPVLVAGTSLHAGLLLAIFLAIALHAAIKYTPFGFRVRIIGANLEAARYAGINTRRHIVGVMLLSGGLAGLAGAAEVLGLRYRLYDRFSPGYGFDGIAAALLAQTSPLGTVLAAAFFGALRAGANQVQQALGIEVSIVLIIQAIVMLLVVAGLRPSSGGSRRARPAAPLAEATHAG